MISSPNICLKIFSFSSHYWITVKLCVEFQFGNYFTFALWRHYSMPFRPLSLFLKINCQNISVGSDFSFIYGWSFDFLFTKKHSIVLTASILCRLIYIYPAFHLMYILVYLFFIIRYLKILLYFVLEVLWFCSGEESTLAQNIML